MRILDGLAVFCLGFLCFVGIDKREINLIRWPSLVLFIYGVIEYCLEHLYRLYTPKPVKDCERMGHVDWINHFLIPSIHLSLITLFLWRSAPTAPPQLIKYSSTAKNYRSNTDEMRLLDISEDD